MGEGTRSPGTIVKICGLTRLEDARAAAQAGADWLGFVVRGESPRRIAPEAAAEILAALPGTTAVAVMVAPSADQALAAARTMGATRVQLHQVDPATWPKGFPLPVAFAVPVAADGRVAGPLPEPGELVLLDAAHETLAGGTGRTIPIGTAVTLAKRYPVMIAGGLSADNVADVIRRARPFGVDASSGLEITPGVKDPERVRRFVAAVRAEDAARVPPSAGRGMRS